MPATQHTETLKLGESMKQTLFMGMAMGICMGIALGVSIKPSQKSESVPSAVAEASDPTEGATVPPTNARPSEKELLLMAIEELNLTTAELETAKNNIMRMERKARRYDWLRDNGLHGDRSMSFNRTDFGPSQKLIEFLSLDEPESEQLKQLCEDTYTAATAWEQENAVCTEDTHTNCIYEIAPLPDSFREGYVAQLGEVLHEEDIQLLGPAIDDVFHSYGNKRIVSATFIPAEEYAASMKRRGQKMYGEPSDKIRIKVQRLDEHGNKRGSSSSTFSADRLSSTHNETLKRWNHLFDLGSFAE